VALFGKSFGDGGAKGVKQRHKHGIGPVQDLIVEVVENAPNQDSVVTMVFDVTNADVESTQDFAQQLSAQVHKQDIQYTIEYDFSQDQGRTLLTVQNTVALSPDSLDCDAMIDAIENDKFHKAILSIRNILVKSLPKLILVNLYLNRWVRCGAKLR